MTHPGLNNAKRPRLKVSAFRNEVAGLLAVVIITMRRIAAMGVTVAIVAVVIRPAIITIAVVRRWRYDDRRAAAIPITIIIVRGTVGRRSGNHWR